MRFFKDISIKNRLFVILSSILGLMLIMGVSNLHSISLLSNTNNEFVNTHVASFNQSAKLKINAQEAALLLLQVISQTDREQRITLYKQIDEANAKIDALILTLAAELGDLVKSISNSVNEIESSTQSRAKHVFRVVSQESQGSDKFL